MPFWYLSEKSSMLAVLCCSLHQSSHRTCVPINWCMLWLLAFPSHAKISTARRRWAKMYKVCKKFWVFRRNCTIKSQTFSKLSVCKLTNRQFAPRLTFDGVVTPKYSEFYCTSFPSCFRSINNFWTGSLLLGHDNTNSSPSAPAHFLSETTFRPGLPWSSSGRNEQNEISLTYMYSLAKRAYVVLLVYSKRAYVLLLLSNMRPAGSDPGAGRQKILFLKVGVSLSWFAPSVAHGKLSVRGRCVQATKNKAELALSLTPLGAVRAAAQGSGCKNRRLGKSHRVRYDTRWVWNCLLPRTVRYALSLKLPASSCSCSHFECLWEHSGCFSSSCIVVGAVNFTVTPAKNFVSPLSESSPSSRKHKKKSVSPHDSQFIHGERSPTLSSSFFLLLTLRSTEWKWTAFDRRRGDSRWRSWR